MHPRGVDSLATVDTRTLGAADITLTAADLQAIDAAAEQIQVEGERYPEQLDRMIDR